MRTPSQHPSSQAEPHVVLDPLPSDYPEDLVSLDTQLAQLAAEQSTPAGLADRVFAASCHHLSAPVETADSRHTRLTTPHFGMRVLRVMWGGRLAMAASLAFAFLTAIMLMQLPMKVVEPTPSPTILVSDLEWPDAEPVFEEDEVAYLFEMEELTSHEDLADDIQAILAELQM